MILRHFLTMAFQALVRNRMQTALAMLGVMVGVGALVTSIALGRGAQQSVEDQLRAAGANLIVVTAGNYAKGREEMSDPDGNIGHTAIEPGDLAPRIPGIGGGPIMHVAWAADGEAAPGLYYPMPYGNVPADGSRVEAPAPSAARLRLAHFEDDPLAMHDHPTAKDRLGDVTAGLGSAATLTRDDAAAIRGMAGVQHVVSGVHENAHIFVANDPKKTQWFTRLHGTEWALPEIRSGWTITHGRFLNAADATDSAQVMVLGRVAADKLFGEGVDPVGRTTTLWNQPFKVIGVVGSRSWATQPEPGDDQFDAVYVPVTTINRLLNLSKLNTIAITAQSAGDVSRLSKEIKLLLRKRHKIGEEAPDDFTVATIAQQAIGKGIPPQLARIISGNLERVDQLTIEQLSSSLRRTNVIMLALLASVAAVSLLVGGIGVMNLLLLSVTQRTREVGLRIALGARRSDIALQFVLEALLLCVIGGVLGIVCGVVASGSLQRFFQWSTVISPWSALAALIVAALLGIAFSVYPARRAALLDPIEALRHE
ncbi:ABC transporter permease [Sphingomonas sp.]|uniref:ABC transporter permease n=1 Tax=Sphingomonas sp. TaxID=28214 RepID=UPI003B3A2209